MSAATRAWRSNGSVVPNCGARAASVSLSERPSLADVGSPPRSYAARSSICQESRAHARAATWSGTVDSQTTCTAHDQAHMPTTRSKPALLTHVRQSVHTVGSETPLITS